MIKRSENGSITLFTLIAMIFLLTIAFTAYVSAMAKLQAQNAELDQIKANYGQDITPEGLASLYEEITTKKPYTVTFDANGGFWYPTFDGYSTNSELQAIYWKTWYFDDNMNQACKKARTILAFLHEHL